MADDVARLVAVLEANIKGFSKGMEQAQKIADRRFGQIERRMQQSERRFAGAFRGLGSLVLGGGALIGIQRFVSAVADMAGKLQDTSDALGVSTDALQTWGILAGRAGVGQDQFNKALGQFSARLGEAQLKGGQFAKFLDGIGVGTKGTTEEVFNRIADAVKNTADQQQRAAIVAEAFGARAVKLTPIIQQGSAALKAQGIEFSKNGQIMSREAIAKIDELGDKWEDLKRQFITTGANALLPLVEEISSPAFQQGLNAFAKAMSEVAVVIARMAPHLPTILATLVGFKAFGGIGAAVGGVSGLALEAYNRQLGLVSDSIAKLERDLANAEARAARREPGAADQAADIRAKITRQKAGAAGIPFAGAGTAPTTGGGIDRTGTLGEASAEDAKRAAAETRLWAESLKILGDQFNETRQAEDDFRRQQGEAALEARRQGEINQREAIEEIQERELEDLQDFHTRAEAAWASYYERLAEGDQSLYDGRLQATERFFSELATLSRSSNETLAGIGKASAIILATIDGIRGVQRALADYPFPYSLAVGAAVGAVAAANVAAIAGMERGGRVSAGTPYIVGEKRPELFVPDAPGRIIPRVPSAVSPMMGGGGTITINAPIDARGAQVGVADQIEIAMARTLKTVERQFPTMMVKTQRDRL